MSAFTPEALKNIKVPGYNDRVFKDECMFSYDTPLSPNGIYVSLMSFRAYGHDYIKQNIAPNVDKDIFLHIKMKKVPKPEPEKDDGTKNAEPVTKLGIGIEGGFKNEEQIWDTTKEYSIYIDGAENELPYPSNDLPMGVTNSIQALLTHSDANLEEAAKWEEPPPKESKYANDLVQDANAPKISPNPKDWKCEDSGMTENLWLNLSDGYIGSGRRNWDGSGGTGAALKHFEEMQKEGKFYPLCVKLGTITPKGADIYSYAKDENDMVTDPKLAEHLSHFGINIMQMQKTEKSMAEMQIELNLNFNYGAILEDGVQLVNCYAPGRIGLKNLGNSCYMNSCLQTLMSLEEFKKLKDIATETFRNCGNKLPSDDMTLQLCKLASGLHSDRYLKEAEVVRSTMEKPYNMEEDEFRKKLKEEEIYISPMAFKSLAGKGHPDFKTSLQQDASEYLAHLFNLLETEAKSSNQQDLSKLFTFEFEERMQMISGEDNGKVKYKNVPENILKLAIPLSAVDNLQEVETSKKKQKVENSEDGKDNKAGKENAEKVLPNIPFQALLDQFNLGEKVDVRKAQATKSMKISKFSKYLWINLNRVIVNEQWQQEKLDHTIFMPETLDLTSMKGNGKLDSEVELPEDESDGNDSNNNANAEPVPDANIVSQIAAMGFSENAGKRAAVATQNAGIEPAMQWVMTHMGDADINDPLPSGGNNNSSGNGGGGGGGDGGDPALIAQICSMGFSTEHAKFALKKNNNNGDVAVMWLFENSANVDTMIATEAALAEASKNNTKDDTATETNSKSYSGKYKLKAFISHVGRNTNSGHYVCHVKDDSGKWIIFNDRKVSWSMKTPIQHGYMYLYVTEDE